MEKLSFKDMLEVLTIKLSVPQFTLLSNDYTRLCDIYVSSCSFCETDLEQTYSTLALA